MNADQRKSFRQRAYGARHQRIRKELARWIAVGGVKCARCGEEIEPGSAWDLGHDDKDRSLYSGPEHRTCNRGAPHRNKTSRVW